MTLILNVLFVAGILLLIVTNLPKAVEKSDKAIKNTAKGIQDVSKNASKTLKEFQSNLRKE